METLSTPNLYVRATRKACVLRPVRSQRHQDKDDTPVRLVASSPLPQLHPRTHRAGPRARRRTAAQLTAFHLHCVLALVARSLNRTNARARAIGGLT
jgi:hypothetical protein